MLVKVAKSKLVLGTHVYKKDDVFECRDAEAAVFIASGIVVRANKGTQNAPAPQPTRTVPTPRPVTKPPEIPPFPESHSVGAMAQPVAPQTGALSGTAKPTTAMRSPRKTSGSATAKP